MTPEEVGRLLVSTGAVEIRPDPETWFTWASGVRSPVYCDNRRVLSFPVERRKISDALAESVATRYPGADVVAGTATAGIPWAGWVAERLELPMVYVRGEAKKHGRNKRVEGKPLDGETVVVVEDLLSYGGSALSSVEALRAEGGEPVGVQAIVTWGFAEVAERFEQAGVTWSSLTHYQAILNPLELDPEQSRALQEWRG